MQMLKDFIKFTNINKMGKQLYFIVLIASLLYCAMESVLMNMVYQIGNIVVYFIMLYGIVLCAGYGCMMILFQFLQSKRGQTQKLNMRTYVMPYIKVQTILSSILIGGSYLLYVVSQSWLYSIVNAMLLLCILFYFPIQIFSMFLIYDGYRKSMDIIRIALQKMLKHYRSIFYSYISVLLLAYGCSSVIMVLSGVGYILHPSVLAIDFLLRSNPFMLFFELFATMFQSASLSLAGSIALIYGIVMHVIFVFYFMFMACIYDENIHV